MKRRDLDRVWPRSECRAKRPGEQGIALISVILLILVLSFVSAAAIVTSTTELKIGGNFKTSAKSFYNAEAGVQYALGQIRNQYAAGALDHMGSEAVVHYTAPKTFSDDKFPFSNWTTTRLKLKTGTSLDYEFQTTGYYGKSQTSLRAVVRMPSWRLVKGMFASGELQVWNKLTCVGSPAPEFGSNTSLFIKSNSDGFSKIVLGGNATCATCSDSTPSRSAPRGIPANPQGAASLVDGASKYFDSTDNAITGDTTLQPGNYYLTSLESDLTISGSGPVNIYVAGTLALDGITINPGSGPLKIYYRGSKNVDLSGAKLNSGGPASNLWIISDTEAKFEFKNHSDFSGLIYAPFAHIDFQNKADLNGLLWGNKITTKNTTTFQYDETAASFFGSLAIPMLVKWEQL